ncbi:MAG: hypothetical protein Sylvanvirus7_37 [Sylvanvirus sp.]|uniref:Serine protease n=1 Tax=Sylvanvirus sp. TaxID=2487774 RepID=A0A3G5ALA2_9VIRU|nr:MAG: hypothetical protein Sylvanvirus7_37 [Sylvanvirus sp.]
MADPVPGDLCRAKWHNLPKSRVVVVLHTYPGGDVEVLNTTTIPQSDSDDSVHVVGSTFSGQYTPPQNPLLHCVSPVSPNTGANNNVNNKRTNDTLQRIAGLPRDILQFTSNTQPFFIKLSNRTTIEKKDFFHFYNRLTQNSFQQLLTLMANRELLRLQLFLNSNSQGPNGGNGDNSNSASQRSSKVPSNSNANNIYTSKSSSSSSSTSFSSSSKNNTSTTKYHKVPINTSNYYSNVDDEDEQVEAAIAAEQQSKGQPHQFLDQSNDNPNDTEDFDDGDELAEASVRQQFPNLEDDQVIKDVLHCKYLLVPSNNKFSLDGKSSKRKRTILQHSLIEHDLALRGGASGAPIFTKDQIIGVHFAMASLSPSSNKGERSFERYVVPFSPLTSAIFGILRLKLISQLRMVKNSKDEFSQLINNALKSFESELGFDDSVSEDIKNFCPIRRLVPSKNK